MASWHQERTWRCIAEDGNGKIHIFIKVVDETGTKGLEEFEAWVRGQNLTILAMYREMDVTEFLEFTGE